MQTMGLRFTQMHMLKNKLELGSGCGTVGREVRASDTRRPGFESSHRLFLLSVYLPITVKKRGKIKQKEAGNDPF